MEVNKTARNEKNSKHSSGDAIVPKVNRAMMTMKMDLELATLEQDNRSAINSI